MGNEWSWKLIIRLSLAAIFFSCTPWATMQGEEKKIKTMKLKIKKEADK